MALIVKVSSRVLGCLGSSYRSRDNGGVHYDENGSYCLHMNPGILKLTMESYHDRFGISSLFL